MNWTDIAMLTFSCTAANHMGLISAAEEVLKRELPILNCPKCLTFWLVLFITSFSGKNMIEALAVSFLSAWVATWLELGMGFIDTLYLKLYDKIYKTSNDTITTDSECGNSDDSMPGL